MFHDIYVISEDIFLTAIKLLYTSRFLKQVITMWKTFSIPLFHKVEKYVHHTAVLINSLSLHRQYSLCGWCLLDGRWTQALSEPIHMSWSVAVTSLSKWATTAVLVWSVWSLVDASTHRSCFSRNFSSMGVHLLIGAAHVKCTKVVIRNFPSISCMFTKQWLKDKKLKSSDIKVCKIAQSTLKKTVLCECLTFMKC